MSNEAMLIRLKTQFNRLSKERQAEVLGMAKALTYVQQCGSFDINAFMREIVLEGRTEKKPPGAPGP
jgi:hypothetical protein